MTGITCFHPLHMTITPVPFTLRLVNDLGRSGGLHLSSVIRDIGFALGYIPPQYLEGEMQVEKICLGQAWEDHLAKHQHPDILYHPGEILVDGIAMSPDGLSYVEHGILHEFKLTWKSMAKERDLESQWLWIAQMMGYCHAHGLDTAWLHVFWVNGNYKYGTPEGGPQYKVYQFKFSQKDLKSNWRTITGRAAEKGMIIKI